MPVKEFTGKPDAVNVREFNPELDQIDQPSDPGIIDRALQFFDPGLQGIGIPAEPFLEDPLAAIVGTAQGVGQRLGEGAKAAVPFLPEIAATGATIAFPPAGVAARAGATFLPKLAQFGRNIQKPVTAAATAGAGGGVAREAIQDPDAGILETGEAGFRSGVQMAGAEFLGQGAVPGIAKLAGITKSGASNVLDNLIDFAKAEGLPISPSALAPSATKRTIAKILEGGTDLFLPSRLINRAHRTRLANRMNEMIAKLPGEVGQELGPEATRNLVKDSFDTLLSGLTRQAKSMATEFLETVGTHTLVNLKVTKPLLQNIKKQAKDKRLLEFVERELEQVGKKASKTAETLEGTLRQMRAELGRVKGKDKNLVGQLREAIKADFQGAGANMQLLNQSDKFFAQNAAILREGGALARQLRSGRLPPEALTRRIFSAGNEEFAKQIKRNLPSDVWDNLAAQNIADRLDDFSRPLESLPGVRVIFKTDKFKKYMAANRELLEEVYDPKTIKALDNLSQFAERAAGDIKAVSQDLTASLVATGGGAAALGGTGGIAAFGEPVVLFGSGMSLMMARSLMNPDGILKTYLTTGLPKTALVAETAAKLGLRFSADQPELELPEF